MAGTLIDRQSRPEVVFRRQTKKTPGAQYLSSLDLCQSNRGHVAKKFKSANFIQLSLKVFDLGLSPKDIVVFSAVLAHGGKNGNEIRPSYTRIMKLTGLSRATVARCLQTLLDCRMIEWERGRVGRANVYRVNEYGLWKPVQSGDGLTSSILRRPPSQEQTTGSSILRPQPYALNYIQEPEGEPSEDEVREAKAKIKNMFGNMIPINEEEL